MMITFSRHSRIFIVLLLAIVFFALRLPGLDLPYHQDEWKNVSASATLDGSMKFFTHPPLMAVLFAAGNEVFGIDGLRILPLIFSIGAAVLLYLVVRGRAGKTAAFWATGFFALCAYCIHGSLSPDVDGAVLPFFFLLAAYAYDRWGGARLGLRWFALFIAALLIGSLIKLSFVIAIGAFALDWAWANRKPLVFKRYAWAIGIAIAFGFAYVALLYIIQATYPAFSIAAMLGHAGDSAGEAGRNWIQIIVQAAKAAYLLSPLLIAPLFFMSKDVARKSRVFSIYLVGGLLFYFVAFDFSRAALDKYLMFLIVPLAAIVGMIAAEAFKGKKAESFRLPILIGAIISIALVALNFLPQEVAALYPKTEWFSRVAHGHWNILNPFTGGNGPMGFYVSFLFIVASFMVSAVLAVIAFFRKPWRPAVMAILIVIGIAYNGVFAEELLYGRINGSGPDALATSVAYIAGNDRISQVLTYNDIGAGPLSMIGKYAGRIYATPDAEEMYRAKFAAFDGHYMVIDIPHLYETGFYGRFFEKCEALFETRSGRISGKVYDCSDVRQMIGGI